MVIIHTWYHPIQVSFFRPTIPGPLYQVTIRLVTAAFRIICKPVRTSSNQFKTSFFLNSSSILIYCIYMFIYLYICLFVLSINYDLVSDEDNSEGEDGQSSAPARPNEMDIDDVPEIIEKHLSPDDLFKDIQEVKDKLQEVRELLDPGAVRVKNSVSEGFLQRHAEPRNAPDHTDMAEGIFDSLNQAGPNSDSLISQLKELRAELATSGGRKTPEGAIENGSIEVFENLSNLAGFLESKIEGEKLISDKRAEEELIERAANEIFNETFENILNPKGQNSENTSGMN